MNSLNSLEEYTDQLRDPRLNRDESDIRSPSQEQYVPNANASFTDSASPFTSQELPVDLNGLEESLENANYGGNNYINNNVNEGNNYTGVNRFGRQGVPNFKVDDFFVGSSNLASNTNSMSLNLDDENGEAINSPVGGGGGGSSGAGGTGNSQYYSPRIGNANIAASSMNQRSSSVSNQMGKSYTSQLGTSLNNLLSPTSTYDGAGDSPYGSYQGSYNDSYLKSPMNSPSLKAFGSPASIGSHLNPKNGMSKEGKLSRRRELHNAVERRRRDLIKEKIRELGTLVPPALLYDSTKLKSSQKKEIRANKSTILAKSVDYIRYLQEVMKMQDERRQLLSSRISVLSSSLAQPVVGNPTVAVPPPITSDIPPSVKEEPETFGFTPVRTPYSSGTSPFAMSSESPSNLSQQNQQNNQGSNNNLEDADAYLKEFLTTTPSGGTPSYGDDSGELSFDGFNA
ncbi:DEKNAAC101119 [Brettanomyces naardenensis]|uniref:DEKNAAC101119 n=1 Tax=Brettanomyces naardenensis TaxID=13370 RepID=A0A448YHB6_BRENA|nr:DEKNAAC101119 [Brettanomyces naardenensis]